MYELNALLGPVITFTVFLILARILLGGTSRRRRLLHKAHLVIPSNIDLNGVTIHYVRKWSRTSGFQRIRNDLYISEDFKGNSNFASGAYYSTSGRIYNFHRTVLWSVFLVIVAIIPVYMYTGNIQDVIGMLAVAIAGGYVNRMTYVILYIDIMKDGYPPRKIEELTEWESEQGFWLSK